MELISLFHFFFFQSYGQSQEKTKSLRSSASKSNQKIVLPCVDDAQGPAPLHPHPVTTTSHDHSHSLATSRNANGSNCSTWPSYHPDTLWQLYPHCYFHPQRRHLIQCFCFWREMCCCSLFYFAVGNFVVVQFQVWQRQYRETRAVASSRILRMWQQQTSWCCCWCCCCCGYWSDYHSYL